MARTVFILLFVSFAFITAGLLAVLIGIIVAFLVAPVWLFITFGGLLFIAIGSLIIIFQIRQFMRVIQSFQSGSGTRTRIKR